MIFGNKWPIKVIIFNRRAEKGVFVEITKAQRRSTPEGEVSYILKKNKKEIPPVLYKHITNNNWLFLYCDKTDSFAPMRIQKPGKNTYEQWKELEKQAKNQGVNLKREDMTVFKKQQKEGDMLKNVVPVELEPAKLIGINTNVKNWSINSVKKGFKLWQNPDFFAKYGHFVATAGILIAISVMIYISLDKIIALDEVSANAAHAIAEACKAGSTVTPAEW